jgi:hypothetical protein
MYSAVATSFDTSVRHSSAVCCHAPIRHTIAAVYHFFAHFCLLTNTQAHDGISVSLVRSTFGMVQLMSREEAMQQVHDYHEQLEEAGVSLDDIESMRSADPGDQQDEL